MIDFWKTASGKLSKTLITADFVIFLGMFLEVYGNSLPPWCLSLGGLIFRFLRLKTGEPVKAVQAANTTETKVSDPKKVNGADTEKLAVDADAVGKPSEKVEIKPADKPEDKPTDKPVDKPSDAPTVAEKKEGEKAN